MSTKTMQGQFSLKCLDQRIQTTLMIDKKKILIGSDENADFRIQDKSVSSYHAFICLKGDEGFMVKNLYSEGGIFINGSRVEESFVTPGDVLTIGTLSFCVETIENASVVINADEAISPATQLISSIALPPREGWFLLMVSTAIFNLMNLPTGLLLLLSLPNSKGTMLNSIKRLSRLRLPIM